MRKHPDRFAVRASVVAVRGALIALAALPAAWAADAVDPAVAELTTPKSTIEVGAGYVSQDSYKFGEYNGLFRKGLYGIFNIDARGGGAWDSNDTTRWRFQGTDLGLENRNLNGEYGQQGRFRLTFGYDELRHNVTDSYKTPYYGTGSNQLTLSGYPVSRLAVTNTATAILANWNNIQSPYDTAAHAAANQNADGTTCTVYPCAGSPAALILGNLHNYNIETKRNRGDVGFSYLITPEWEVKASVRHETKDGSKLVGFNMNRFSGPSALLPEPVDSTTDLFEASLRWTGAKGYFSLGYSGSLYKNDVNVWTADYAGQSATASAGVFGNQGRFYGAPDNQSHQVNFTGGYNFTKTTKLVVTGSYARLTQNERFPDVVYPSTWIVPVDSADAKVINTFFSAKLTSRPIKTLNLGATYRYTDRDNQTPENVFRTLGGDAIGAAFDYANEPNRRRQQQVNLDADWAFMPGQALKAGYEWQEIKRRGQTYSETPFPAEKVSEDTFLVEYRNNMVANLSATLSYAYSQRKAGSYEDGDPAPVQLLPTPPVPGADPLLPGFRQFWLADRNRDKVRAGLDWQATDELSLQARVDYNRDSYNHSQYGVKEGKSWSATIDGAYAPRENLTFSGFYTFEDQKATQDSLSIARGTSTSTLVPHVSGGSCASFTNVSGTLPADYYTDPCRQWSALQSDRVHTVGLGFKSSGLFGGKFALSGDAIYTHATTPISMGGGTYFSNSVPNSSTGNFWIASTSFPDIRSELIDLRLTGTYTIDKQQAVRVGYRYAHLKSNDWQYDAYANSSLGVLASQIFIGPGITAPNYNVSVVGVSYLYTFR